jgi:23S rRNA (cytidine1920-2'-O)/16S rRNA (cytidine1409-2'-O)-methyltransferase
MAGEVRAGGSIIEKPGTLVEEDLTVDVKTGNLYVSRGGIKLEGAFRDFGLNAKGKKAIDVGSSTGGFTDFLLKKGARKVVCIDVGYGQLSWELRKSPNVIVLERTNIRNLDINKIPYKSDITVADLSFISIRSIFKKIIELTANGGEILLLVKPQFELKKEEVENKGIIRSIELHFKVLNEVTEYIRKFPVEVKDFSFSKIKGAKGNIEFWIFLIKTEKETKSHLNYDKIIRDMVSEAHFYYNEF